MQRRTYLVTGGAGFIGSHLVDHLIKIGCHVRVLDNFSSGREENLSNAMKCRRLAVVKGDIRNYEDVSEVMKGIDGVFHLAALVSVPMSVKQPADSFEINVHGSFNVFEAARKKNITKVIYASSAAVYGDNDEVPVKEMVACNPMTPYALDKLYSEQLAEVYWKNYKISSVGLRYFNVYGERQDPNSPYSGVITIFARTLNAGRQPCIYGNGSQTRDFVYIRDVVDATALAMEKSKVGAHRINVATGKQTTICELLLLIQRVLQTNIRPDYKSQRSGDIRHSVACIEKLKSFCDIQPQWDIQRGLEDLLKNHLTG